MMWMGKLSACLAVLVAAAILISLLTAGDFSEFGVAGPIGAALLLLLGAYRSLRALKGGLRLLCGAWGATLGLAWYAPSYNFPPFVPGVIAIAAPVLIAAAGLALTVLHKER